MWSVLGMLCLLYYGILCAALKKWDSTFSRFWLVAGIGGVFLGQMAGSGQFGTVLRNVFMVPFLAFLLTEGRIMAGMKSLKNEEFAYLIVLGAQVDGRRITDSLHRRLEKARLYLLQHPDTRVIVSGGQGKGEDIPEAEAMASYLEAHGITGRRIIKEDRSKTTKENLTFSIPYIGEKDAAVGIVSNNFHLYRAICYAKRLGYQRPYPLAAGCHPVLFLNYMVREAFAVWKMWLVS